MNELFEKAFLMTLGNEGGYSDDKEDPGGETKYGISHRAYPHEDIRNMTLERAKDIYYNDYWLRLQPFELPDRIALLLFDMAVNMGRAAAVCRLQEAVHVKVDGVLGPKSRAALIAGDSPGLVTEITARRIMYYTSLDTFRTFGFGWVRRSLASMRQVLDG